MGFFKVIFAGVFCTFFAGGAVLYLWIRMADFFLADSAWVLFALVIVWFSGMGVGALIFSLLSRRITFDLAFGGLSLIVCGIIISLCLYLSLEFGLRFEPEISAFFKAGLIAIFPVTLLLGIILPFSVGLQISMKGPSIEENGLLFGVAFLGAFVSAASTGWFIIPHFGPRWGLVVCSFMVMSAGLLMLLFSRIDRVKKTVSLVISLGCVYVVVSLLGSQGIITHPMIYESKQKTAAIMVLDNPRDSIKHDSINTASVMLDPMSSERILYKNAYKAASTAKGLRVTKMAAHLCMMVCPDPARALVIGYGVGGAPHTLAKYQKLNKITIAEPSHAVMAMADKFKMGVQHNASLDPVSLSGREYLLTHPDAFDLILLSPTAPESPGACHTYTGPFYDLCLNRLKQGGVLCHSIPLRTFNTHEFNRVVSTFCDRMPGSFVFLEQEVCLLFGFTKKDWKLDFKRVESAFKEENKKAELLTLGYDSPLSLLVNFVSDGQKLSLEAKTLNDDKPFLQYLLRKENRSGINGVVADNMAFLRTLPFKTTARVFLDQAATPMEKIRRTQLSSFLFLQGFEHEARMFDAREDLDFSAPWKACYEKAFALNSGNKLIAASYARSLAQEALYEISQGNFIRADQILIKSEAIYPPKLSAYKAEAYLALAARDVNRLTGAVRAFSWHNSRYSALTFYFSRELARLKGNKKDVEKFDQYLAKAGHLTPRQELLMKRVMEVQALGQARAKMLGKDALMELLFLGWEGKTESGQSAWSLVALSGSEILQKVKKDLLALLNEKGEKRLKAIRGLGYFKDKETRQALFNVYGNSSGKVQKAALKSLALSGDTSHVIQILDQDQTHPNLVTFAAKIAGDLKIADAVKPLINRLESKDLELRCGAFLALVQATGQHFDYDPKGAAAARTKSIKSWRGWLKLRSKEKE